MSHHVYTTGGLVLRLRPVRETDSLVGVLTEDLGLVSASARGTRQRGSKLTSALLPLSLAKVSLVRGRNAWRVTTVTLLRDISTELRLRREALASYARVVSLVEKLVRGEDKNPDLFRELERAAFLLLDEVGDRDVDAWELLTVAKVLYHLGYLSHDALPSTLNETREKRGSLISSINESIKTSGLH
jgi:DNA repair protein RecO